VTYQNILEFDVSVHQSLTMKEAYSFYYINGYLYSAIKQISKLHSMQKTLLLVIIDLYYCCLRYTYMININHRYRYTTQVLRFLVHN